MDKQKLYFTEQLYEQVFEAIPVGLILIDSKKVIYAWNDWMVKNTKIEGKQAIGQTLESLYSEQLSPRYNWAIDQVLNYSHPQVLSNVLNKFIIPIPLHNQAYLVHDMMQQHVEILPINLDQQQMALVVIQDVSAKTHLNSTLMSMASKYEKSSFIDMLTGIYNRRFLWNHLETVLTEARREKYNVICCMYDVDHFKTINDRFGHKAGDEVLKSFVNISRNLLRENDCFFRYGGEEFITISTRVDIKNAASLPNRLRKHLENTPSHGSVNEVVTCSVGIACWQPSDPNIAPDELINQADTQLYKAKQSGRNCTVMNNIVKNGT